MDNEGKMSKLLFGCIYWQVKLLHWASFVDITSDLNVTHTEFYQKIALRKLDFTSFRSIAIYIILEGKKIMSNRHIGKTGFNKFSKEHFS